MARKAPQPTTSGGKSAPSPGSIAAEWSQGRLPQAIMLLGPETALREEALAGIRKAAFADGDGGLSWVVLHASGEASELDSRAVTPAQVLDEVSTPPLFGVPGEPKVVVLRQAELLLNRKVEHEPPREVFERNLPKLPAHAVLVFEVAQAGLLKNTRFYKAIAERGGVIACEALRSTWGLDGPDSKLALEVERVGRTLGLRLTAGATTALIARSGQDLGVLQEELGKLALTLGSNEGSAIPVGESEVERICANARLVGTFEFVDAVAERDAKRAWETLGAIFDHGLADYKRPGRVVTNEGSIAMSLLGALSWRLGQLQDIRSALDAGTREYEAFAAAKVFGPRQEAMRRTIRKHTSASLRAAMEALFQVNLELRTGHDRRTALEQMASKICRNQ